MRRRCACDVAVFGKREQAGVLALEMVQDVLQAFFDPAEIHGLRIGGSLQPLEQKRYALLDMREGGGAVVAPCWWSAPSPSHSSGPARADWHPAWRSNGA